MTVFLYIVVFPLIILLAILPFRLLYFVSDFAYFVGYVLLRYRAAVVRKNLQIAFPEKTSQEIRRITRRFYRNFFDIILETLKLLVIPRSKLKALMIKGNMEILDEYYRDGQSVILASSHLGNWEYGSAAYALYYPETLKGVYKPLSNQFFNQLMYRIRDRFDVELFTINETLEKVRENINSQMAIGLLSDQNPSSSNAQWLPLFDMETPVYTGIELLARRFNLPVIYLRFDRLSRGKYVMNAELITADPSTSEKLAITKSYLLKLERDIRKNPENWLWTHNRWKRVNRAN